MKNVPLKVAKSLAKATSYRVDGAQYSAAFRNGYWDGRENTLKYLRRGDAYRAPAGMARRIIEMLDEDEIPYKLDDRRVGPRRHVQFNWSDDLRPYQIAALEAATASTGPLGEIAHGIIRMPIRSGKTRTAAGIIAELSVPTLFLVTSQLLLDQSCAALGEHLGVGRIGRVGDSEWSPGEEITVATMQTLLANSGTERYKKLVNDVDLIVTDEAHHLVAEKWRKVVLESPAAYKLGLSATVWLDEDGWNDTRDIWLRASTGPILYDISTSDLIEAGFLMRPEIRLYPIREPNLVGRKWSGRLHSEAIHLNRYRNAAIVRIARSLWEDDGLRILVVCNRHNHIRALLREFKKIGLTVGVVFGSTPRRNRESLMRDFRAGKIPVLMGTVFGEGVDIPEVEVVINAEGGKDRKSTIQRMRNLTPSPGKERAVFVDFVDLTNSYFAGHSADRKAVYSEEIAFQLTVHKVP